MFMAVALPSLYTDSRLQKISITNLPWHPAASNKSEKC